LDSHIRSSIPIVVLSWKRAFYDVTNSPFWTVGTIPDIPCSAESADLNFLCTGRAKSDCFSVHLNVFGIINVEVEGSITFAADYAHGARPKSTISMIRPYGMNRRRSFKP
jgi:hypothetical protein